MEKAEPKINLDEGLICEYCGKVFQYKSKLTIHRRSHTGEKPYTCGYCGSKFAHYYSLKNHKIKNMCIKQKPQEDNKFGCEVCGKRFKKKWLLKRHILSHSGEKKYTCDFCATNFKYKDNCLAHMREKVCIKRDLQIEEKREENQPLDLSKPRPIEGH